MRYKRRTSQTTRTSRHSDKKYTIRKYLILGYYRSRACYINTCTYSFFVKENDKHVFNYISFFSKIFWNYFQNVVWPHTHTPFPAKESEFGDFYVQLGAHVCRYISRLRENPDVAFENLSWVRKSNASLTELRNWIPNQQIVRMQLALELQRKIRTRPF